MPESESSQQVEMSLILRRLECCGCDTGGGGGGGIAEEDGEEVEDVEEDVEEEEDEDDLEGVELLLLVTLVQTGHVQCLGQLLRSPLLSQ